MGKFDWGRFGSALATNVGNTGQQFFMNKMLQEEEDKRAYTKSQADALTKLYQSTGNQAYLDQLEKLNDKGATATAQTFRAAPLPTQEQIRQQELTQFEEQEKIKNKYKTTRPTELETKLGLLDSPEGREKLKALAEMANTLSVKDKLYLKNLGLDIQIKTRKLSGDEPVPTAELVSYPEEKAGATYKQIREKGTRPLSV